VNTPLAIVGELTVDMDNRRARYDCFRADCAQRREGPVRGDVVPEFIRGIKTQHLAQFHGEQR
jgi:hypothetical protein